MELTVKDMELVATEQSLFDAFNHFILSPDLKVFGKLLARTVLFEQVKDIPGDVVECGVFRGTGMLTFLKLKRYFCPNTHKKVIGFDFFDSAKLLSTLHGIDKDVMTLVFDGRNITHDTDYQTRLQNQILSYGFSEHEFELIGGDISLTSEEYVRTRPGAKISLLYLDLDLELPTYNTLRNLWDRVSSGGLVVFDEYAYHRWSESVGVDQFFADKNVQITSLNYLAPTACVVKP